MKYGYSVYGTRNLFWIHFEIPIDKGQRNKIINLLHKYYQKVTEPYKESPMPYRASIEILYNRRIDINEATHLSIYVFRSFSSRKYSELEFKQLYDVLYFFVNPILFEERTKFIYEVVDNSIKCMNLNDDECNITTCKYAPFCFYIIVPTLIPDEFNCSFCERPIHLIDTLRFRAELKRREIDCLIPCCDCFLLIEKYGIDYIDPKRRKQIIEKEEHSKGEFFRIMNEDWKRRIKKSIEDFVKWIIYGGEVETLESPCKVCGEKTVVYIKEIAYDYYCINCGDFFSFF